MAKRLSGWKRSVTNSMRLQRKFPGKGSDKSLYGLKCSLI